MGRNLSSRTKRMRRIGEKLLTHGEKAFSRRPYPPGQHGPKGLGRSSEYGVRLREKQKAQLIYGVLERQLRRYVEAAKRRTGDTGNFLIAALESRLDNVTFRSGFAASREAARQLVRHGHVAVDGRRVNIPSSPVRLGQTVALRHQPNTPAVEAIAKRLETYAVPAWIELDPAKLTATLRTLPTIDEAAGMNVQFIIEFYSR